VRRSRGQVADGDLIEEGRDAFEPDTYGRGLLKGNPFEEEAEDRMRVSGDDEVGVLGRSGLGDGGAGGDADSEWLVAGAQDQSERLAAGRCGGEVKLQRQLEIPGAEVGTLFLRVEQRHAPRAERS
jgi:hypothetical protein